MPKVTLIAITVFVLVVWITRYVSMGSVTGALTVLILVFVFPQPIAYRVFAVVAVFAVLVLHRSNFKRVLQGTEHKFGTKK